MQLYFAISKQRGRTRTGSAQWRTAAWNALGAKPSSHLKGCWPANGSSKNCSRGQALSISRLHAFLRDSFLERMKSANRLASYLGTRLKTYRRSLPSDI